MYCLAPKKETQPMNVQWWLPVATTAASCCYEVADQLLLVKRCRCNIWTDVELFWFPSCNFRVSVKVKYRPIRTDQYSCMCVMSKMQWIGIFSTFWQVTHKLFSFLKATKANKVWGKVIFSQVSVCLQRGVYPACNGHGVYITLDTPRQTPPWADTTWTHP